MNRRRNYRKEREAARMIAEEQAAMQRMCVLFGLCPKCLDDLPLRGPHICPEEKVA